MFFIVPENNEDLREALVLLAAYSVAVVTHCDLDGSNMYLAVINDPGGPDEERLAEIAFQVQWHTAPCPRCNEICGDLAFSRPI